MESGTEKRLRFAEVSLGLLLGIALVVGGSVLIWWLLSEKNQSTSSEVPTLAFGVREL